MRRSGQTPNPTRVEARTPGARIAIARVTRRSRERRRGGVLGLVLALFLLVVVGVTGTAIITVGGATVGLIASLDKDLPDVKQFESLTFPQPTRVYDKSGQHVLASFLRERRNVVGYQAFPKLVLDATTAVEDRTFWENQGFDLQSTVFATIADLTNAADRGGASSITQQLVRARLLPKDLFAPGADIYTRKAKEIIQAAKLTQAFPGEKGKQRIITAYLNQISVRPQRLRHRGRLGGLLRQAEHGPAHAQPGGAAGRPSAVTFGARPLPLRQDRNPGDGTRLVVPTCKYTLDASGRAQPKGGCTENAPVNRRNFILRAHARRLYPLDAHHAGAVPQGTQRAHRAGG